eukprot:SAG31_NODE_2939_length_4883_cov_6.368102_4_plen_207_part_00
MSQSSCTVSQSIAAVRWSLHAQLLSIWSKLADALPVPSSACHNLCQNDFTGPTLALAACDPRDGRQQWAFQDLNNKGRTVLRQLGGSGLCAGCGDRPIESCANTAPGSAGANYGPPTWPMNLTKIGLGLGMQACIGAARQAFNYSTSAGGMLTLPKGGGCLGAPNVSASASNHHHPVVLQKVSNGDCDPNSPQPHQQWVLKTAERG